jgi:autotransporter-associated beta strand protein
VSLLNSTLDMNAADSGVISFATEIPGYYSGVYVLGGLKGTRGIVTPRGDFKVGANHQNTTYAGALSGPAKLVKIGTGTLTLTGVNTHGGDTEVSEGTLTLSGSGSIAASSNYIVNGTLDVSATPSGLLAVAVGKTLSGSGTVAGGVTVSGTVAPGGNSSGTLSTSSVTLTGTYACEITGTACDVLAVTGDFTTGATTRLEVTGTPTANRYVIATYTGSLGSLAFADSPVLPGGYDLQVDLANKQLLIVKTAATNSPYATWTVSENLVAGVNDGVTQDPDGDGTPNILEFVLGGDPLAADAYLSPVVTLTADHFIFTFNRSDASEQEVALDFQSGSDLATWTEVAIGATSAGSVGVVENGDAPDTVTVTLARSNQAGALLLCRLKAALKTAE